MTGSLDFRGYNVNGFWLSKTFGYCIATLILVAILAGCSAIQNTGFPDTGEVQFGMASWYGEDFHGCITTSGEKYDMYDYTAAHRTLPFGTSVRVTNVESGKSVVVKVNDRGPWKNGRVIDLSYAAAKQLGMILDGIVRVKVERAKAEVDSEDKGLASWYGQRFHRKKTASGETFDMNKLTAAHRSLPFGTVVKVTNMDNGKSVSVKINDRMPKAEKTIINLSKKAAQKLDILKNGTAMVSLYVTNRAKSKR